MRTSIVIEDQLAARVKEEAQRRGISVSRFFSEAAQKDLTNPPISAEPFKVITRGHSSPYTKVNLDKISELFEADDIEKYGNSSRETL